MSTINIAGLTPVDDPSYRYKMPRISGKVEGRGNGIKTVLVNVTDIAQSLNRESQEITKFFGCELGSQTTYAVDTDRAIVNGAHKDMDLQNHLSRYIECFVLCKNCRLPETHYKIKDGLISQKCLACGSKDSVDMTHKLTAFILAQHKKHKEASKSSGKDAKKKDKKDKSVDKSVEEASATAATSQGDGDKKKASKEKDKVKDKDKKSSKSVMVVDGDKETVFNAAAAVEEEEEESDSRAAEEGIERFQLFLTRSGLSSSSDTSPLTISILDELRNIQTMASLPTSYRSIIFLGAVFNEQMVTENQIKQHASVLRALAATPIQQRQLISSFEWLCGTRHPSKVKFFPVMMKQLLDEELVDEDTFLAWAGDFTRNEYSADQSMVCLDTLEALKASAAPFITWLQEAEEEDSEEDGNDDDAEEGDEEDDQEEEEA